MLRKAARLLSIVFHPIFVPVYLFVMLTQIEPVMSLVFNGAIIGRFVLLMFFSMVFGPVLCIYQLKRSGMIDSMEMPSLRGRSAAFFITVAAYLFTLYMLKDVGLPRIFYSFFIGLIVSVAILAMVSSVYKASAHLAAMGGVLGTLAWLFVFYGDQRPLLWVGLLILTGGIASARLYLQAHDLMQVTAGFVIGFASVFGTMTYLIA